MRYHLSVTYKDGTVIHHATAAPEAGLELIRSLTERMVDNEQYANVQQWTINPEEG